MHYMILSSNVITRNNFPSLYLTHRDAELVGSLCIKAFQGARRPLQVKRFRIMCSVGISEASKMG